MVYEQFICLLFPNTEFFKDLIQNILIGHDAHDFSKGLQRHPEFQGYTFG